MHPRHRRIEMPYAPQEESSPTSCTFSTLKWKFDVFLSFRGEDTRLKFTDHLYDAFTRKGIRGFRDDKGIERGEVVEQQLDQAIKDSLCAVVVLSENYADSTWCLDELQEILESRKKFGQKVFPVFYGVDPADVRYQRKSFGVALAKHEKGFKKSRDKVQKWRDCLEQVSNFSGWDSKDRHETDVIQDIVEAVWNTVRSNLTSYDNDLVGIDSRMAQINSLLEIDQVDDIRFVGIWGMGGVGKTTLARVVFERISGQFEMSCFLSNVREISEGQGLRLPNDTILHLNTGKKKYNNSFPDPIDTFWNKRILLVLDNVSHMSQLEKWTNSRFLGAGSRLIITTRNLHLLKPHGVHGIYEVKPMEKDESLQLFSKKAFKKDHPEDNYFALSKTVVKYAGGLPLALYVLGTFLCGRSHLEWEEALERMKQIPDNDIFQILKISYLGLNDEEKTIFLDIACFFNGWKRDEVAQILKNCDFHPTIGINILIERALLTEKETMDGEKTLEVHDLLQELARSIVFQESPHHIYGRSRVWNLEDIDEVLKNDQGSKAVQAIALPINLDGEIQVHHEAFTQMCNLRLLIISSELNVPSGLSCFSSALKVIIWKSYPLEELPVGTQLDKLVDIQMPFSKIRLCNGMQLMKNLKCIDLSNSQHLVKTPDFSEIPNLEKLNLEGCSSLIAIHHSLGELKKLVEVNLSCCGSLEILPKKLEMNSLAKFDISWCEKLSILPEFGQCMKKLTVLDARKTYISKLPESLGLIIGLRDLNLRGPRDLVLQMSSFYPASLTMLDLSYCGISDGSIPEDLGGFSSLITLRLEGNLFSDLPTGCFSNLFQLRHLYLNNCRSLKSLPKLPPRLIHLYATGCESMEPLSSDGMGNIVSSLNHEHRYQTNHEEERMLQPIQPVYVPEADFLAIIPNPKIPSWFRNRDSVFSNGRGRDYEYYESGNSAKCELVVDVPPCCRASKWCGLVVCLNIKGGSTCDKIVISWSCKAPEDYYICKEWKNEISLVYGWMPRLCLMLLDFNEKTCWQHLGGNNNRLHIKLSVRYEYSRRLELKYGWRMLCMEEIQERGNPTFDFNNLTQAQHHSCPELPPPRESDSYGERTNVTSSSSNHDSSRSRENQGRRNPLVACWKQFFH